MARLEKVKGRYYQLVENYRDKQGKPKKKILRYFGKSKPSHEEIRAIVESPPPLPDKKYQIILADPPWKYELRKSDKKHRNKVKYPTMTINQIKRLRVDTIADDNCYLFMWTTKDHIKDGIEILEHWGFDYKNIITWVKVSKSGDIRLMSGHWGRNCTEFILIGKKGKNARAFSSLGIANIPTAFTAELPSKHSKKPEIPLLNALCEKLPNSPKIELFCRSPRDGWEFWGDELSYN